MDHSGTAGIVDLFKPRIAAGEGFAGLISLIAVLEGGHADW
jgi:hypothetical protein